MTQEKPFETVLKMVRAIPAGRVMSYGQVGSLCGYNARTAAWALAMDVPDVPWHRVVGVDGDLLVKKKSVVAGIKQRQLLEAEGVEFRDDGTVDMDRFRFGVLESDTLVLDNDADEDELIDHS